MDDSYTRSESERTWIWLVLGLAFSLIFVGSAWPLAVVIVLGTLTLIIYAECGSHQHGVARLEDAQIRELIARLEQEFQLD